VADDSDKTPSVDNGEIPAMVSKVQRPSRTPLREALVSVVIPVFNESATIEEILYRVQYAPSRRRARETPIRKEIVVVDDASTDGTRDWLLGLKGKQGQGVTEIEVLEGTAQLRIDNIRIFLQEENAGKGAALRRGFAEAAGDILLVQDADLEYDPEDYPKLLAPIIDGRADVVYGSRFLGGPQRVLFFWHYVGNTFLTLLSDMFSNLKITDMETCYKVFRKEVLANIRLKSNRFGFEPEITAKIAKGRWRVYEVPISYSGRTYEEGKKITWKDGVQALWCIIRYSLFD
jgi:glycosyltransferase involved in cell wall biosynthesis